MKKLLTEGYTKNMQTAISLPDQIYYEAEETAQYMGIPRSKLYLNALVEYLKKNNRKKITEKLNEIGQIKSEVRN